MAKSYTARPDDTFPVRVDLPQEVKAELRSLAGKADMAMSKWARLVILDALRKGTIPEDVDPKPARTVESKPAVDQPRRPRGRPRKDG